MWDKILKSIFFRRTEKNYRRKQRPSAVPAIVEMLENRQLLSAATVLLADPFNSPTSSNINLNVQTRQTGELAGATYSESAATQNGGSLNNLSQVNNVPNTLLLGVMPSAGLTDNFASPNINFANNAYDFNHAEVTVTPLGSFSTVSAGLVHWAGLEIGAAAGTLPAAGGTGVTIDQSGDWNLYDNGVSVASGTVTTAHAYTLAFDVIPGTGNYQLSINGNSVYSGNHGSAYTTNYISLEDQSSAGAPGFQLDYFGNLLVTTATNLLTDGFATSSNSADVNDQVATRQTGLFAGTSYTESALSGSGGSAASLTQVNNSAMPNTLLLATSPVQESTFVSPNANFFDPKLALDSVSVTITPLGSGTNDTSFADHWAGMAFGGPGASVNQQGVSGFLIRANGRFAIFENGVQVFTGNAIDTGTYTVEYTINPQNGSYVVSVNGVSVYSGTHGAAYPATDRITLEDNTTVNANGATTGTQVDYFSNLQVMALASPYATAANTTFYVSPTGSDTNNGTSPLTPWKTFNRVNEEFFMSGDQFLLQGGSTFAGTLQLTSVNSGSAASPVVIGSYGTGNATINAGTGSAITLTNVQNITISNLTLVGSGYNVSASSSDGIAATSSSSALESNITITGINASGFGDSGIKFIGYFNNVSISNSTLDSNGNGGLRFGAGTVIASQNIYIGYVTASNNAGSLTTMSSGYGIYVAAVQDGVIEHSTTLDNGWLAGNQGATGGIEAIDDNRMLIQYNEAGFNVRGVSDGDGIVLDSSSNSIVQDNYTHDNNGAGILVGAETGTVSNNNVIRDNISQNDARSGSISYGGIVLWENVSNTEIYNNTIYMSGNSFIAMDFVSFSGTNAQLFNNIFAVASGSQIVTYPGGGSGITLQGNDYWAYSGSFNINWNGTDYKSLAAFQAGSGQEGGIANSTGFQVNPGLIAPGTGGSINNPNKLTTLTAYELSTTSALLDSGTNPSQFSISWDPDSFGTDAFMSKYFNSTPVDFYGDAIPASNSGQLSVGAYQ